ncbi:hypothetical protein ACLOJK_020532, partial [Asimina triloba]
CHTWSFYLWLHDELLHGSTDKACRQTRTNTRAHTPTPHIAKISYYYSLVPISILDLFVCRFLLKASEENCCQPTSEIRIWNEWEASNGYNFKCEVGPAKVWIDLGWREISN